MTNTTNESGLNLDHLEAERTKLEAITKEYDAYMADGAAQVLGITFAAWNRRAAPVSAPIAGDAVASVDADHLRRKFIAIITSKTSLSEQRVWDLALALMAEARAALANQPAPTVHMLREAADIIVELADSHGAVSEKSAAWVERFLPVIDEMESENQPAPTAAPEQVAGAHHLEPAAIQATINDLREIESGTPAVAVQDRDWRTWAGVLARTIEHLFVSQPSEAAPLAEALALLRTARDDCGLGSELGRKVDELLDRALAHQPAQEQARTTSVTETKRAQLAARGYEVVGYVMQNDNNNRCTVARGRVNWQSWAAQHEADCRPSCGHIGAECDFPTCKAASPVVRAQSEESADMVRPPRTPEAIVAFVASHFDSIEDKGDVEDIRFTLSVHDLLSAMSDWFDGEQAHAGADDPVVEANRQMLLDRSRVGIGKYGTTLAGAELSREQLIRHALEESLDLSNYLQALLRDPAIRAAQEGEK